MSTLEKVMQLKQQGIPEYDIIQSLKQEGLSPREINEALSQSNIKSAVSSEYQEEAQMQPSIMQNQGMQIQTNQENENSYSQENIPYPGQSQDYQYPSQDYQQQDYQYPEYQPQQSLDIETINDIAEQIAEEKSEKLRKQISSISGIKDELSIDVKRIDERLKKIENTIENLQIAILRKIGSYGEDIQNISKEMHLTQQSFSKVIDPLSENIRALKKISSEENLSEKNTTKQTKEKSSKKRTGKSEPSFEDYLR